MKRRNFISGVTGLVAGLLGLKSAAAAAQAKEPSNEWEGDGRDLPTTAERIAALEDLIGQIKTSGKFGLVGRIYVGARAPAFDYHTPYIGIEVGDDCGNFKEIVLQRLEGELDCLKRSA